MHTLYPSMHSISSKHPMYKLQFAGSISFTMDVHLMANLKSLSMELFESLLILTFFGGLALSFSQRKSTSWVILFNRERNSSDRNGACLLKVVMRSNWHEHCSVQPKAALIVTNFWWLDCHATSPSLVSSPCQLYINSCPCPPIGWIIPCRSLETFICKFVPEVLGYVSEMVCAQAKGFCCLYTLKGGRWRRQAINKWTAEAPW